jgi:hypothetical protein
VIRPARAGKQDIGVVENGRETDMKKIWLLTMLFGAVTFITVKKTSLPEPMDTNDDEPILFV